MILQHEGLQLSSVPTANHKQLIYVRITPLLQQRLEELQRLNPNPKDLFQLTTTKYHIQAYVDPSELSYNSFQNILNLDEYFFGPKLNWDNKLRVTIDKMQKINNYYKFDIKDHDNLLMQLHKMNLYSLPFNNLSRGGKRMIFSSLKLADALYEQLRKNFEQSLQFSYTQQKWAHNDSNLLTDFNSVNHVFRLNSFSPNSGNFKSHYDTPFSDNQRKLYSKYTLLIYLTGGSNPQKSCLRIADERIQQIPAFTGIIFDQGYEHQGWPYLQGEKVFIRSELIYYVKDIEHDQIAAEMFNRACYFQKEAFYQHNDNIHSEELQKYSNQLFNHTAKLRYHLTQKKDQLMEGLKNDIPQNQDNNGKKIAINVKPVQGKYLLKKNLQVIYVTDGNSFWFRDCFSLKFIAKLVLIDYFNGRIGILTSNQGNKSQRTKIKSKMLKLNFRQRLMQNSYLNQNNKMQEQKSPYDKIDKSKNQQTAIDESIIEYLDQISFQDEKQIKQYPFTLNSIIETEDKGFDIQQDHCSLQDGGGYTSQYYEQQAKSLSLSRFYNRMDEVGVVLFNGKVHVNDNLIKIHSNKGQISFNNAFFNKTINFASCQCPSYRVNQFIAKQTFQVEGFLLPNIKYRKLASGYKLSIDMFKNGFIHRMKVDVSRPYAVEPSTIFFGDKFYDSNDEYVNSDSDFDQVTGKRHSKNQESLDPDNLIKKRHQMNEQDCD